jgi:hypothetical protein
MFKEMALRKKQPISDKQLNIYVANFMMLTKGDDTKKVSKEQFYNFYKGS